MNSTTSINKIIQRAAFDMFCNWSKVAYEKYPDLDFTIKDETELVNDTKEAINKALKSLFSSENHEKIQDKQWRIGYVIGFIRGNLGTRWFTNYVSMQSDDYKYMLAVKSILEYSRVDSDLSWRLDNLYKKLYESTNLEYLKHQTQVDVAFVEKYLLSPSNESGIVLQTLDNLMIALIEKIIEDPSSFRIPDREYFSHEEINSFIVNWQETYYKNTIQ